MFVLLALDLGVFHRKAHAVSIREAAAWSVVWVTLALIFNLAFYLYMRIEFPGDPRLVAVPGFDPQQAAQQAALEFLAGYVVEYSLSVDNIFVFVVVLSYFAVPAAYQHRVLFFGILGALVFRAIFIALGAALLRFAVGGLVLRGVPGDHRRADDVRGGEGRCEPEENAASSGCSAGTCRSRASFQEQSFFVHERRPAARDAAVHRAALPRDDRHRVRGRLGARHLRA